MVFSSIIFVIWFLPVFFLFYFGLQYLIPKRKIAVCNSVLLVASLIFYAWDTPIFLFIMLLSILINYSFGIIISGNMDKKVKKAALVLSIILNLGLLGYFKYSNFVIDTANQCFGSAIPNLKFALPIGISFFTFQGLSYVIDVHREKAEVQRSPFKMAIYISMFPQLIAGPIVRYETICSEINKREMNLQDAVIGLRRFTYGLAKKVLIANMLGETADKIFSMEYFDVMHMSAAVAWYGAVCYTMQIYFDFSGYSDMAIGLGRVMGFHFLENFDYPYLSRSITEFWRRWHISLSSFFRDYVYIPMGGNRRGNVYIHLIIVFLLTGLWHGASWTFVLWGAWHGAFILLERGGVKCNVKTADKGMRSFLSHIWVMLLVTIGWVIFKIEHFSILISYLKCMFGFYRADWVKYKIAFYADRRSIVILIIAFLLSFNLKGTVRKKMKERMSDQTIQLFQNIFSIILLLLCVITLTNSTYNPFIYFKF